MFYRLSTNFHPSGRHGIGRRRRRKHSAMTAFMEKKVVPG
jgi:hypothetical protein